MGTKRNEAEALAALERPGVRAGIAAAALWGLAWKGASLWRAAQDGSKPWFATLLVTNTLGVLDAVYLFGVSRRRR
ncbi:MULTISPECIES: DUF5652 family protein [Agrococcus]|uniref:DUF5652 domain-containing protein n=1 Tax=Agrococcus pavilionensis RW1 TaxID=1330458 RepID=U1LBL3_9MICO|nr:MULTISPECIES: DUF5652 family protein [Agrococcus]ERG64518.1 hypothetical protein L332_08655 [Agrococcus pavilionensis RW1]MBO1770504.1 hypothetical protein [Agrococcus sp. TF02-05]